MQGHAATTASIPDIEDSLNELAAWGRVRGSLVELAAWGSHNLGTDDPLEALNAVAAGEPCPRRVKEAVEVMHSLSVPTGERARRYSLAAAFEELELTDVTAFDVFRRRKLSPSNSPTLESLAKDLGVTRERVRQIEKRVRARIDSLMLEPEEWPIGVAALRARKALGPVADIAQLASLGRLLDPSGAGFSHQTHRMMLVLMLAGPYHRVDNWLVTDEGASLTQTSLEHATEDGPADLDSLAEILSACGIRMALCQGWIEHQKGYRILEGKITRWHGSLADKAEAVIRIAGEPLTPEQIFERIDEQHKSFRGFKGQLVDARFRRRALNLYGLTEWGGEEYTSVVDEMTEELERQGGSMDLDELATMLAHNFGVSESSVRMYAGGPQFHVDVARRVARRTGDLPLPDSPPLGLTRACFCLHDGWALRRTVDHDITRGSGSGLPIAFAKELGLNPEASLRLDTPLGEVTCSWPSHTAHIGSLRAFAKALGAVDGDHLFIVHLGAGRLDIRMVRASDCAAASGYRRLALECGRRPGDFPERKVAASLGLSAKDRQLATAIRLRLRTRGESDLAQLVPDEPPEDGLLDALASLGR